MLPSAVALEAAVRDHFQKLIAYAILAIMGWLLFQGAIFSAVMVANIHWQVTPNNYLAGFAAAGCAYGTTWLITEITAFRANRKALLDQPSRQLQEDREIAALEDKHWADWRGPG